jgi:hypothetical protein
MDRWSGRNVTQCYNGYFVLGFIPAFLAALRVFFRSRLETSLEVLALRQQIAVLKRKRPRPSLDRPDRLFWTILRSIWPRWSDVLVIVKPATVLLISKIFFTGEEFMRRENSVERV